MKIAICLLTSEPEYLEEWLNHHENTGFDNFLIYFDSNTTVDFTKLPKNCIYNYWGCKNNPQEQMRCYEHCCKNNKEFDYILFIDSDEFYQSKSGDINTDIHNLIEKYGNFDGLGIYWRFYGSNLPFEERQPIENYTQWHPNNHIKSLLNPKVVVNFPNPHKAFIIPNKKYIDELGRNITSPIGNHTSEDIWIKHTWTRSKNEWETKVNRKGWYSAYKRKIEEFEDYNKKCINVAN